MFQHKTVAAVATVLLLIIVFVSSASADRRSFVWTYQYATMPAGETELEYYFGYRLADQDNRSAGKYTHQIEIETGITDRLDVSLYQMFAQTNSEGFAYDGVKLRSRLRLFEAGQYPLDPLLYAEIIRPSDHAEPTTLEGKLILARDFAPGFGAFNLVAERELGEGHELEWEYTVGLGYEARPSFSLGIEAKGNFKSGDEAVHAAGPTMSWASRTLWFSAGVLFPLNENANDVEFRYILGFDL